MRTTVRAADLARCLTGAAVGGVLGHFLFLWIAQQGLYAMVLPGAALGLGAGALAKTRSLTCGIISGLLALALAIVTEWRLFPFARDDSFAFFITHVHGLPPIKLTMIGLGGLLAFWFGQGRTGSERHTAPEGGNGPC